MTCNCSRQHKKSTMRAYSVTQQTLTSNAIVEFDNFIATGCSIEANGAKSIRIAKPGVYAVMVSGVAVEGGTAGTITLQLEKNGVAIPGAYGSQYSASTADVANIAFSTVVEVLGSCACANNDTSISLMNTGVGATLSKVEVDVVKLC